MGSFGNQSIRTVARKMLGGATDLLLGCLVGCVTDWQQETRSLFVYARPLGNAGYAER
jgi:hypothetical protein